MLTLNINRTFFFTTNTIMYVVRKTNKIHMTIVSSYKNHYLIVFCAVFLLLRHIQKQ